MSKTYSESRSQKTFDEPLPAKGAFQDVFEVLLEGLCETDNAPEFISHLLLDMDEEVPVDYTLNNVLHSVPFCSRISLVLPLVSGESYCP